jgi:hypothetical protein
MFAKSKWHLLAILPSYCTSTVANANTWLISSNRRHNNSGITLEWDFYLQKFSRYSRISIYVTFDLWVQGQGSRVQIWGYLPLIGDHRLSGHSTWNDASFSIRSRDIHELSFTWPLTFGFMVKGHVYKYVVTFSWSAAIDLVGIALGMALLSPSVLEIFTKHHLRDLWPFDSRSGVTLTNMGLLSLDRRSST